MPEAPFIFSAGGAYSRWPPSPFADPRALGLPAPAAELDFRLPTLLLHAREAALRRIRPVLRAARVSEAQWRLMRVLEAEGRPLTATEIAARAGGTDTNARLAARIPVRRGHLAWRDDPGPGRTSMDWRSGPWLALTPAGLAGLRRLRGHMRDRWRDGSAAFPARRQRALAAALADLAEAAGAPLPAPLPPPEVAARADDPPGWGPAAAHELDLGPPLALRRTRTALLVPLRAVLRPHGLSEPQWRCLRLLEFFAVPVTQRAVIRAGCFLGAEARHALSRLSDYGLVRHDTTPRPPLGRRRRRFPLALTPAGRHTLLAMETRWARAAPDLRANLTAGRVLALARLLDEQARAWLAADPPAAHPLADAYAQQEEAGRGRRQRASASARRG